MPLDPMSTLPALALYAYWLKILMFAPSPRHVKSDSFALYELNPVHGFDNTGIDIISKCKSL